LIYIGITAGRAVSGFIANKIEDRTLIRIGIGVALTGIILIAIPLENKVLPIIGLVMTGVGCAPIYPSIIHSTPYSFGKENSQAIIGIQMAFAYTGATFMPPLFGLIAQYINIGLYPFFILILGIILIVMTELANKIVAKQNAIL
ncbi:MAG TPA: MFS transporter, partial [Clostridia bacterium]|nr:MFS transporter [Clostridia bacterium]